MENQYKIVKENGLVNLMLKTMFLN